MNEDKVTKFFRNLFIILVALLCGLVIWLLRAVFGFDLPAPV